MDDKTSVCGINHEDDLRKESLTSAITENVHEIFAVIRISKRS